VEILNSVIHWHHKLILSIAKRNGLVVGENFYWGLGSKIDQEFCHLIRIGDNVTFAGGGGVQLVAHDASMKRWLNYTRIGKIDIGNRVYIGGGTVILPGVIIGDDVVIGARSVVSRDIPSGSVAVGSPAKVIGQIDDFIKRKKKEMQMVPNFGQEYVKACRVLNSSAANLRMRKEMYDKMKNRYGFIL